MVGDVERAAAAARVVLDSAVVDVTDPGDFAFPRDLKGLVNNAGVRRAYLPVEETPAAEWRDVFAVNVFGLVEMTRRAIPILRANGGGAICNVTSSAVVDIAPFFGAYRSSKAAVSALSEGLRVELAPFGIRVVEILPGATLTDMARDGVVSRPPEATRYEAYAAMGRRQHEVFAGLGGFTPVDAAAAEVVDALLDHGGPMRYGTDALSRARIEAWRLESDEARMRSAVALFSGHEEGCR